MAKRKVQPEITNLEETVPSTIVEGTEQEVFANPEAQVEVTQAAVEQTTQPEQAAPKPPRVSKRPYIARCLRTPGGRDARRQRNRCARVGRVFPKSKKEAFRLLQQISRTPSTDIGRIVEW